MVEEEEIHILNILGRRYLALLWWRLRYKGTEYTYIGFVENNVEIPGINCVYSLNGEIIFHKEPSRIPKNLSSPKSGGYDEFSGSSKPLCLDISFNDNYLMKSVKSLLTEKDIKSIGDLRRIYGPDRLSGSNNFRARLQKDNRLSWDKFLEILKLLDMSFKMDLFDNE